MKAAVLHQLGQAPRYEDFPDPVPTDQELVVKVRAVALENIDRAIASGTHFSSARYVSTLPAIIGLDGIGTLEDGQLVGFGGIRPPYGALAEKTVIPRAFHIPIPEGVDAVTAAAVPTSALTALFPLKWGAQLQPGETVLVNGATGVSGRLTIQIAKLLGAGRIIGTGRDERSLQEIQALGADTVIDLKGTDAEVTDAFAKATADGIHVIVDYLWGHPTELLVKALIPKELAFARNRIRLIQVGEMAGTSINLPAEAVRTSGLEIMGAGSGLTPEVIAEGTAQVWDLIRNDKIHLEIETVPLSDISGAWKRTDLHGKRLVIVP